MLQKGLHTANFSVLTPEQTKHVKLIDTVFTWHLLNESEEDAIYYVSSLLKANRNNDHYEQYWFPTPDNPGDEQFHTPIQRRILQKLRNEIGLAGYQLQSCHKVPQVTGVSLQEARGLAICWLALWDPFGPMQS